MLKKPLFVFIFVSLFIGLSDYGYGCHKVDEQDPPQPIPHGKNGVPCGDPEPPPDDGGNKGTPVIVTFDDWEIDSIQSDHVGGHDENGNPFSLRPYNESVERARKWRPRERS